MKQNSSDLDEVEQMDEWERPDEWKRPIGWDSEAIEKAKEEWMPAGKLIEEWEEECKVVVNDFIRASEGAK